jgi:FG-GAP-like repeat
MGANGGGANDFSDTPIGETTSFLINRNLYWNGGAPIPQDAGELINFTDDAQRVVADPLLGSQSGIPLPRLNPMTGTFADGFHHDPGSVRATGHPVWDAGRREPGDRQRRRGPGSDGRHPGEPAPDGDRRRPRRGRGASLGIRPRRQADITVYRGTSGQWFVLRSAGSASVVPWGAPAFADVPVPADYDGDGQGDVAVFRGATGQWFIRGSTGPVLAVQWGAPAFGDRPVPADYDGDGKADIAVFRFATGQWFILASSSGVIAAQWGAPSLGDRPAPLAMGAELGRPAVFGRWPHRVEVGCPSPANVPLADECASSRRCGW